MPAVAVPAVYLSDRIDDGGVRWRFFMLKRHRLDLWARSRSINLTHTLPAVEPGALIVCYAERTGRREPRGEWLRQ